MATMYDEPDLWDFDAEGNVVAPRAERPQPATLAVPSTGFEEGYQQGAGIENPDLLAELPQYVPPQPDLPSLAEAGRVGMDDMAGMAANPGTPSYQLGGIVGAGGNAAEQRAFDAAESVATAPVTVSRTPNSMYPEAQQMKARTNKSSDARLGGEEDIQSAEFGRKLAQMEIAQRASETVRKSVEAREAAETRREQRLVDQHEASVLVQEEIAKAAKAYQNAPEEDPGRFWESRTAFQKVMLTISAIAKGWLQGQGFAVDPMGTIKAGIREDIDAQRSNRSLLGEKLNAREREASGAREVYNQLRSQISDEGLRDEVIFNGRMRAVEAELAKVQAEAMANGAGGEWDKAYGATLKEIADSDYRAAALAAKQPEYFTKISKAKTVGIKDPSGNVRQVSPAFAAKYAQGQLDQGADLRKQGLGIAATGAQMEGQESAAASKDARAAAAARGKGPDTAQQRYETATAYRLKQDTAVDQGVVDQITDLREKYGGVEGDLPGFGTVGVLGNMKVFDNQQAAYYDIVNTLTRSLRPETGAAYTAQEIDNASGGIINEGRSKEDNAALQQAVGILSGADEADVWHILDEVEKKHRRRIRHLQEGVPKHILEQSNINAEKDLTPRARETVGETDEFTWEE